MFLKILGNLFGWGVALVSLLLGVVTFRFNPYMAVVFFIAAFLFNPIILKRFPFGKTIPIKLMISVLIIGLSGGLSFGVSKGLGAFHNSQVDAQRVAMAIDYMKDFQPRELAELKAQDRTIDNPAIEIAIFEIVFKHKSAASFGNISSNFHKEDQDFIDLGQKKCVSDLDKIPVAAFYKNISTYQSVIEEISYADQDKYFADAVNKGNSDAIIYMASLLDSDRENIKSYLNDQDITQLHWAMKAYELSKEPKDRASIAQTIADLYKNGYGGAPKDANKEQQYRLERIDSLQQAADKGDAESMLSLGVAYYWGDQGIPKNLAKGNSLYMKAAQAGNMSAMIGMANDYDEKKDYKNALYWYLKSKDRCDYQAYFKMGYYYQFGLGTPKDYAKAYDYYALSLHASNSLNNMGNLNEFGEGRPVDKVLAKKQYCLAAKSGLEIAKRNCAYLSSMDAPAAAPK